MYLNPEIVDSIQDQLEENSEIQLDEFLIVRYFMKLNLSCFKRLSVYPIRELLKLPVFQTLKCS